MKECKVYQTENGTFQVIDHDVEVVVSENWATESDAVSFARGYVQASDELRCEIEGAQESKHTANELTKAAWRERTVLQVQVIQLRAEVERLKARVAELEVDRGLVVDENDE